MMFVRRAILLVALILVMAVSSTPVMADFASGRAAYEAGDFRAAREQWQAPAEAGDAIAQAALGSLYIHGEGVPIDYREALKWTQLAAEQGDVTGQFNMGSLHAGGLGVEKDFSAAARWFHLAAEQYDAASRFNLAILYSRGLGVERDYAEAVYMYNTAAVVAGTPEIGLHDMAEEAERMALSMMMTMDPAAIKEAHRRSKEFEQRYIKYW
ncbi:MAG: tetratricopeptide repeat protein [Proteobacteria bacterium]|nr:tetratricopeptide repeat protein [Pseudomonadota bacterium]